MKQAFYAIILVAFSLNLGWSNPLKTTTGITSSPDLIVINPSVSPLNVVPGANFSVSCDVMNQGTSSSSPNKLGYFLSTDTIWDANTDVLLGVDNVNNLNVNVIKNDFATLTLPNNLAYGNYYILFVVDYLSGITESDETNNVNFQQVIAVSQDPNLKEQANSGTLSINGTNISISLTVENDGNSNASNSQVGYYLSTDNNITTSDYLIGTDVTGSLPPNSTTNESLNVDISTINNLPNGVYYVGYMIDRANVVTESNENDNVVVFNTQQVSFLPPSPDLVVVNQVVAPSTILLGGAYNVNCDVTNIGTTSASNSRLGYYFSTDTTWDVNTDTYLGKDVVGNTNVGALKPEQANFTLPTTLTAGTYYILFVADYLNVITEGDETNNVSYQQIVVSDQLPNLRTYANTDTLSIIGNNITIQLGIENNGLSTSPVSEVGYYLSTDTIITTSDYLIGADVINTLLVNDTTNKMITVDITTLNTIPAGTYYGGYIIDNQDNIYELNENDNISCFKNIQITKPNFSAPDLVVQNVAISTNNIALNGTLTVTSKVKNIGNANAGASKLGYYFSTNASFDPNSDILLTDDQVTSLAPGLGDNETATLNIPSGTTAGTYYILFVADYLSVVNETDENNNVTVKTITVAATNSNLKIQAGSGNLNFNGNIISINVIVENDGTNPSANCVLGYYLSSNANITASDYLIGTDTVGVLSPNGTISKNITVDVSAFGNIPTGNYFVGVFVDNQNAIPETNETDNTYFWTSPLFSHTSVSQSDLVVQNVSLVTNGTSAGGVISTSSQVKNIGVGSAQGSRLGYYLSVDPAWGPTDIFLDDDEISNLTINGIDGETAHLLIPGNTPNGTYYLLFVADYLSAVTESNENNNVAYKVITVNSSVSTSSNLHINTNSALLSVNGTSLSIDVTVVNSGIDTAGVSAIGYYLSTNSTINTGDYLIGFDNVSTLAPGDSSNETFSVDISSLVNIPANTYYIGSIVDYQNTVIENNEQDNSYHWALTQVTQVPYFPSDLTVANATATPHSIAPSSNVFVSAQVSNSGIGASVPTEVGYYLSTDNVFDATDIFLNQSQIDTIQVGQALATSATLTIPTNTVDGSYYILFVADHLLTIDEINEGNNLAFQTLTVDATLSIAPFSWTPTNQSGMFLGQANVGGIAASPNDWIAAIGPNGECAGAVQIINNGGIGYISLPIYGDDPNTATDEGIGSGEYFTLRLYDASADRYRDYPSMAEQFQFTQWANMNGSILLPYNSTDTIYNFAEYITDTIALRIGWNLISMDAAPYDSSVTSIFSELITNGTLEYITGFNAGSTIYDANGQPVFNTLTHIERGYGYWVKMNAIDTLLVDGLPMDNFKIDLNEGWNLSAYIPQASVAPEAYYKTLIDSSNLVYVTGFDNGTKIFDPNGATFLNTLTSLDNGFGYWVKVNQGIGGAYYRGGGFAPTNVYDFLNGTTNLTEVEYIGEEINVLDEEGNIVAVLAIAQGGYIMTTSLYGDDLLTSDKDGIDINDPLYFEFKGIVLDEGLNFQGNMTLFQVDLQFDKSLLTNTNQVNIENANFTCYPNPVVDRLIIDYDLSESAEMTLKVFNTVGQVVDVQPLGMQYAGKQSIQWITNKQPEGTYIFSLEANGKSIGSQKILIVK